MNKDENGRMNDKIPNVYFIGAGNVATHLSLALQKAGYIIIGVYSRTNESSRYLAKTLGCSYTSDILQVPEADIDILSVKDSVLLSLLEPLTSLHPHAIFVHTSGSISMEIFYKKAKKYGVFYPMQTFSKRRSIKFAEIPIFVESSDESVAKVLLEMANSLSQQVSVLDSVRRRRLHLASVFACNFVNHCYALAAKELAAAEIDFEYLLPLIDETARKVHELSPREAQTGPAIRYDTNVLSQQMSLIDNSLERDIYNLMSQSIHKIAND